MAKLRSGVSSVVSSVAAYDVPHYYELALWHGADLDKIISFLLDVLKVHGRVQRGGTGRVLELACGNSALASGFMKRGFQFVGLDLNEKMLELSLLRTREAGHEIEVHHKDMKSFIIEKKCDLAFVMFNSVYRESNDEFVAHLKCVSSSLVPGGLYVLHMVVEGTHDDVYTTKNFKWKVKSGPVSIKAEFHRDVLDYVAQLRRETLQLRVVDKLKSSDEVIFTESSVDKVIYPQEFLMLLGSTDFEFVGWFNGFDLLATLDSTVGTDYLVAVIRKK